MTRTPAWVTEGQTPREFGDADDDVTNFRYQSRLLSFDLMLPKLDVVMSSVSDEVPSQLHERTSKSLRSTGFLWTLRGSIY